ncbi:hypothetical protein RhiirA5_506999 [Rhizophagus irregularis]|uniref:Uncharacterized protein n=1 Tax=Rhizophagus irregularis TaxID=588596 RepID=A0A2N0NNX3_9GLOM|nr:hypothetical protein RhiirA5_506999 [Rhizophagus irregularis]
MVLSGEQYGRQLPPVCGAHVFSGSRKSDHLSEDGCSAYSQFQEIYKLEAMQRQTGNSDKQQQFKNLPYHLRDGKSTRSD